VPLNVYPAPAHATQGVRSDADTVWFGNLMSSERPAVSVRHTGDVRAGQGGQGDGASSSSSGKSASLGGELEDLERIYVDLGALPKQYKPHARLCALRAARLCPPYQLLAVPRPLSPHVSFLAGTTAWRWRRAPSTARASPPSPSATCGWSTQTRTRSFTESRRAVGSDYVLF
jgi:hypothetical protein